MRATACLIAAVSLGSIAHAHARPLPNCSVVFFHHLEKTGGTTLRALFQRYAQRGQFELFSFVNRQNKLHLQAILHKLHLAAERGPAALNGTRIAVEIHVGGSLLMPYFFHSTLRDLLYMRALLRGAGCRCNLVSMVRAPIMQTLSWYQMFVGGGRVPLCFWQQATDCSSRIALGYTCHDSAAGRPISQVHEEAVDTMWRTFDLVGYTEAFDDFVVLLAQLVGLPSPAYRSQNVHKDRVTARDARSKLQQHWAPRVCSGSHAGASVPPTLEHLLLERMEQARESAARRQNLQLECRGYGPCVIRGALTTDRVAHDDGACRNVTPAALVARLCSRATADERIYQLVRTRFDARLSDVSSVRLKKASRRLHLASVRLAERAEAQAAESEATLRALARDPLRADYVSKAGKGVPWKVNELTRVYNARERARFSCVGCSGDVVPEFDLGGCWPLWTQFAPDEMMFSCRRSWTSDPALDVPRTGGKNPLPCWQTCWEPMNRSAGAALCAAPACPAEPREDAHAWRRRWEAGRSAFEKTSEDGSAVASMSKRIQDADGRRLEPEGSFVLRVF